MFPKYYGPWRADLHGGYRCVAAPTTLVTGARYDIQYQTYEVVRRDTRKKGNERP